MQILNKPQCKNHAKCGNDALTLVSGLWLCGYCLKDMQDKLKMLKERLILQEGF